MKKIINWTFGSVFRTIGRILAYLLIALLGVLIIQKNDIKITDLLGIYKVNAATLHSWSTQQTRVQTTHDGTDTWSSWYNINGDNPYTFSSSDLSNPVKSIAWHLRSSDGLSTENTYTFQFGYKATPQSLAITSYYFQNDSTGQDEDVTCTQNTSSNDYHWFTCSFTPHTNYTSSHYLYVKINFYMSYLTEFKSVIRGYDQRTGTNAVITDTGSQIINNQNQNTQEIIDNLTQANQELIQSIQDGNNVCNLIDKNYIEWDNKQLKNDGTLLNNNQSGVTKWINIQQATITELEVYAEGYLNRFCFYDVNKNYISCQDNAQINEITIPNNAVYFRSTIVKSANKPKYRICQNGNQAANNNMQDLLHDINNKDTEEALNGYKDFFNLFTNNGHGLTSIVTAPLNAINSLTNATCSPLVLPLPYMENKNITLPCMRPIYEEHFGNFMLIYDTITFGIISYWVILKLFKLIKNFKNPEDEGIEVVDL